MQFNPGDGTGLVDEINDICNSDNNSYPLLSKARRLNAALDRFLSLAFQSDGRWSFDQTTQSGVPIETQNLVDGTQTYEIDAFTSEVVNLLRLEVTDSSGKTTELKRLDRSKVTTGLPDYQSTDGVPKEYDLVGNTIYLYPAPNYNATGGLRAYIERGKVAFTAASTTAVPGTPSIFHTWLCQHASLPYLVEFQKGQKNDVAAMVQQGEREILNYFANREKGVHRTFSAYIEDTK